LLYRLTNDSVAAPALYMLARVAPRVVGPVFGGSLADRFGPARVASDCAVVQGGLTALIVVLALQHIVWGIYLCVAGAQFLNAFAQPALGALLPRVTAQTQLGRVNGVYNALFSSSILVSPALGALLLPHFAPEALIAADAATFIVASALITTLRSAAPAVKGPGRPNLAAGVPIVLRDRMLRAYAAASCGNSAAITALQAVLVVAASQRFGRDTNVGWLYAAVGAGGVVGALTFLRRTPQEVTRRWIVAFTLLELFAVAGFVVAGNLALGMATLAVSAIGSVLYQTAGQIGLQQRVATNMLGRVSAVIRSALYLGMLIGAACALIFVQLLGWQRTVLIVAAGAFVLVVASAVWNPNRRAAHRRRVAARLS